MYQILQAAKPPNHRMFCVWNTTHDSSTGRCSAHGTPIAAVYVAANSMLLCLSLVTRTKCGGIWFACGELSVAAVRASFSFVIFRLALESKMIGKRDLFSPQVSVCWVRETMRRPGGGRMKYYLTGGRWDCIKSGIAALYLVQQ